VTRPEVSACVTVGDQTLMGGVRKAPAHFHQVGDADVALTNAQPRRFRAFRNGPRGRRMSPSDTLTHADLPSSGPITRVGRFRPELGPLRYAENIRARMVHHGDPIQVATAQEDDASKGSA
jgi:hypothetical protein